MYRILQIDGGGIKGVIPASICMSIEKALGKPINKIFDLITGSSTGAIIGGCLAAGVPAEKIYELYKISGPELFKSRPIFNPLNWFRAKYDRAPFQAYLTRLLSDRKMGDLPVELMATAFGLCAKRTHFVKSWDNRDKNRSLIDVISWSSLSAAFYFGAIAVPDYLWHHVAPDNAESDHLGEVMQDGGQGVDNCTIGFVLNEILARNLDDSGGAQILSLGTGDAETIIDFKDACRMNGLQQIISYPEEALNESQIAQIMAAKYVALRRPSMRITRVNCVLAKAMDKLDAVGFMDQFDGLAQELAGEEDMQGFIEDLENE